MSLGAIAVFSEHLPGMRRPDDWIWKEWEEIQAMSPQGVSEGGQPGGCNGAYPLPLPGQPVQPLILHIKDRPHPWYWGSFFTSLSGISYPLRQLIAEVIGSCEWFMWMNFHHLSTRACILQGIWIWQNLYSRGPGMTWGQAWEACFIVVPADNTSDILPLSD